MDVVTLSEGLPETGGRTTRQHGLDQLLDYMRLRNYEGALGLGLRHMSMVRIDGIPYELIAKEIAANCPAEMKRKYPCQILRLAYELYAGGLAEEFDALMCEIREMIPSLPLSEPEKIHLQGEWLIVSALPFTRNIRTVLEKYEQAAQLLSGPSKIIDVYDSITFGVHGMPGVYLLAPGMADEVRVLIPRLAELFSRFTGETISGMEELYDGALAYYRGNLDEARKLTYNAIYMLEKTKQDVLQISAGEQLAAIATRQKDMEGFAEALGYMDMAAERSINRNACRCLVQLIRSGLQNTLGDFQDTPDWLKTFSYASGKYGTGPFGDKNVAGNENFAPVSYGVVCWYHVLYLMQSGQTRRALAAAESLLQRLLECEGVLILEVYFMLLMAFCHMTLGENDKALIYTQRAVDLVLPDRFYIPLASFAPSLNGMVETCLAKTDKSALDAVCRIIGMSACDINALQAECAKEELAASLTPREHAVACLAARGYRNSEIADALAVSESTVRAHLRSVFQKLDIDRRAKLTEKLK